MSAPLHRRDVLAAFLGAPLALAACRTRTPALPPGELVFPVERTGHRFVRDGAIPPMPSEGRSRATVAIVGGGVAGLAAAWRLRRAGLDDVVLLELDEAPGGTAKSGVNGVSAFPWGAHYVTAPMKDDRAMIALLDELDALDGVDERGDPIVREELLCRAPSERLFADGRWYEGLFPSELTTDEDRRQLGLFSAEVNRWASFRDARGRRAFAIPMARSSDVAEVTALDRISIASWMQSRGLDSPGLRWLVDYACRDDYGSTLEETSAWAALFYFASRLAEAGESPQSIVTWPEGNGRLVRHLAERVRPSIHGGLAVVEVAPAEDGVEIVAVDRDGFTRGFEVSRAIVAAPRFIAGRIVRPLRDSAPAHLAEFRYGAWMVANLTLTRRFEKSAGFPFAWDNVLRDSPSLGYVVATHQRCLDHGPTVITYYYPLVDADVGAARRRLLSLDRDAWADVALADLSRAHPDVRAITSRLDVVRWGHAMIKPRPGFVFGGARAAAAVPIGAIHFAHSDLSALPLFEEALFHGVRAAEEVLAALGRPAPSLL